MVVWSKPSVGVVKVNCKGLFVRDQRKTSTGCVKRQFGGMGRGSGAMIGLVVPIAAELWSIFYGLKLAWEAGDKAVIIESECEEAVNDVNNPDPTFWLARLVLFIKNLEGEAWDSCVITHVPSSANWVATALAKTTLGWEGGLKLLSSPPNAISSFLIADMH